MTTTSSHIPESSSAPLRILVVEDEPELRESLLEVLEEEGYEVVAVASGTDAITEAARQKFDLIVTDIKTPGTDGLSALATVKEDNPDVAGIVITGYSTEEYAMRAAKLKVENYLKKPFDVEDFLRTVDSLARKKRSSQKRLSDQLLNQSALRWLSLKLVERLTERDPDEVERFARLTSHSAPGVGRDPRQKIALEPLSGLHLLAEMGVPWPEELLDVFPSRLGHFVFSPGQQAELRDHLARHSKEFLEGRDFEANDPDETSEDETDALTGSLLNVGLLLESAARLDEARKAFSDLLDASTDPTDRYLARFGLARLARRLHHFEEMEQHALQAVVEAKALGQLTESQALVERGLLLAQAGSPKAQKALEEARDFAKRLKDADSFALTSLALENYFAEEASHREKLVAYLAQPEHFALAAESSDWLLNLLLSAAELAPTEHRLLSKLSRAFPASFERVVLKLTDKQPLLTAAAYLECLDEEQLKGVLAHLSATEDTDIQRKVAERERKSQRHRRERAPLRVFSFSGLRLYRGEEALELKRKKPLLLLLYLLYRDGPVGEEHIFDLFWPGDESKARANLRTTLSIIRKLLSPESDVDPVVRQAGGLSLSGEVPVWFDYREFNTLIERARASETAERPERAVECYRAAVRLYRGPFLENVYEEWTLLIREESERAYIHALERLAGAAIANRQWAQAHEYAERGRRHDGLNTKFCETAMEALLGLERYPEVLALYQEAEAELQREMQIEPTTEMMKLRELAKLHL